MKAEEPPRVYCKCFHCERKSLQPAHLSSPPPASNVLQLTKSRHMVMYSREVHLRVSRSSIAVLTRSDCDQAMKECEFSEKGPATLPNTMEINESQSEWCED
ncbi:uncharacterized protein AB9X84_010856 [Acanthopagrus schlegelii]